MARKFGYMKARQRGIALVVALFIIIAMAAAIMLMQQLQGTQTATTNWAIQRARALSAANSGLEWAVYRVKTGHACPAASSSLSLTGAGLEGFSVQVTCSLDASLTEAGQTVQWYSLTALASAGSFSNSPDFVSRRLAINIAL